MAVIADILFPVDFSDNNGKVIPYVLEMAGIHQAGLHLLYVVRDMEHYAGFYVPHPNLTRLAADVAAGAERKMAEFRREAFSGLERVFTRVLIGDAASAIVSYAQEEGVDLIIMGTHGRKGLEHAIFGSVAEKVVKNSPVPVLTVNPQRL